MSSFYNLPSTSISKSSLMIATLRERRGVTFQIEFTRPLLSVPVRGHPKPAASAQPHMFKRRIDAQTDRG